MQHGVRQRLVRHSQAPEPGRMQARMIARFAELVNELALAGPLVAASVTGTPVARMATVASSVIRRPVRALCAPGVAAGAERERSLVRLVMA